jgi:hypothetical protein
MLAAPRHHSRGDSWGMTTPSGAAEHRAARLHRLGSEVGAGAAIWARAVADELVGHEAARESFGSERNREAWDPLHSTALLLIVAIDQVLSFERRVRRLTGDAELQRARARFDTVGPDAEAVRDLVVHLDDYATGRGVARPATPTRRSASPTSRRSSTGATAAAQSSTELRG